MSQLKQLEKIYLPKINLAKIKSHENMATNQDHEKEKEQYSDRAMKQYYRLEELRRPKIVYKIKKEYLEHNKTEETSGSKLPVIFKQSQTTPIKLIERKTKKKQIRLEDRIIQLLAYSLKTKKCKTVHFA